MPQMINVRELRSRRAEVLETASGLVTAAELEDRDLTEDEVVSYDGAISEADALEARAVRMEGLSGLQEIMHNREAPAALQIQRGDTEARAYAHFLRTGDGGGLEGRASNDTTMNISTDADGGYAVPTGHYQGIIERRDEAALETALGVRDIPGVGTTVNVPVDNEDDGEFVSTAESGAFDRDAPALDQKAMTLGMYTKKVDLTYQLLEDEDSRLLAFLENFVGRGMAKTNNGLLLTEVAANGTALKTFASATVIAVDELEPITYSDALDPYLDDAGSAAWVMRRSVHGEINLLDDANIRRYANTQQGDESGPSLLHFPVRYSYKSGATAASAKSVYFGNWYYVGVRHGAEFKVIRDPFTRSGNGEVIFTYSYRIVYTTLIAEAIGYGVHPSA